VLSIQFEQSAQCQDLEEAILLHREALKQRAAPHPDRSNSLNNLNALCTRFEGSTQREDLEEAIALYYESLEILVSEHPSACRNSTNLGETFVTAYSHTHESKYLNNAILAFRAAATCRTASVVGRFRAAKLWALHADNNLHESALEAYQAAVGLLPRLAMLGLDLQSRQRGLARDAAACAIRLAQYDIAVELLEEGRAVFWSQALQLRTPMTDLRDAAPELEEQLRHISLALEQGSVRDICFSGCQCFLIHCHF
jgi:tetratricopeptide (TPR) repeat protein